MRDIHMYQKYSVLLGIYIFLHSLTTMGSEGLSHKIEKIGTRADRILIITADGTEFPLSPQSPPVRLNSKTGLHEYVKHPEDALRDGLVYGGVGTLVTTIFLLILNSMFGSNK